MNNFKFAFWGTEKFAGDILEILIKNHFIPEIIITALDKKVGRKAVLQAPYVKQIAEKYNLNVWQCENLKNNQDFFEKFKSLNLDLSIVAQYGHIIPKEYLEIPKYGFINVHGSLLPKYRGASPIQTALLNGEKETGITIMQMDEKMDHGEIIIQKKVLIEDWDTSESLFDKLAIIGAYALLEILEKLENDEILNKSEQDHSKASYCKLIKKEDAEIFPETESSDVIFNKYRAFYLWPQIYFYWNGKRVKLLKIEKTDLENCSSEIKAGEFFKENKKLYLKTKDSCLHILELQIEGKKRMQEKDFINAYLK